MFPVGTKIRGYTVERAIDAPAGWHELVARGEDGGAFLLRVPPDVDGTERIRGEAALAKKHKHESLLTSIELVEHNGWPVQVLAYVEGLTLEALQVQAGKMAPEAVCRIGRQVGLALVELHERAGVAHGALAADRILIDTGGNARLIDVGCARPMGPKRLQSPERRKEVGRPSVLDDLWALGVILADAALGGAADPAQDLGAFVAAVDKAALPGRVGEALKTLVAPLHARLTNASAAVRIFTELEKKLGDGSLWLRKAVGETRRLVPEAPREPDTKDDLKDGKDDKDDKDDTNVNVGPPATIPDGAARPFAALMRDLGTDPAGAALAQEPITQEQVSGQEQEQDPTNPAAPRTVEMTPDRVLDVLQMQRMSMLAEEAARRTSGPIQKPTPAQLNAPPSAPAPLRKETVEDLSAVGPPIGPRDIHEEETVSDPEGARAGARIHSDSKTPSKTQSKTQSKTERVPRPEQKPTPAQRAPVAKAVGAARVDDPHTLDDAERAALGTPMSTKLIAAGVVLAIVIGVVFLLAR